MKTTPLTQIHIDLGAKMAEFAGYHMPISYKGINEEHIAVRNQVGVFDVSHMGEFIVKGEKALDLIQLVTSNDASKLYPGKVQYSCFPNENGGIVDDLLVYQLDEQAYMLVVNASNIDKDWEWINAHNSFGAELHNISDKTVLLAVQGPKAASVLQPLTDMDLQSMAYYTFEKGVFAGMDNVLVSATGYTGAGGFEIYVEQDKGVELWHKVFEAGASYGIQPIGLGARDTLRLEMGYCLYGNDIDDYTSPIEAGLGWITKLKNKDCLSKPYFLEQRANGVDKKLTGFEMIDKGIPRHDYEITDASGNPIGQVTSGTMSPSLQKAIGLGYLPPEYKEAGQEIYIKVRNKSLKAQTVDLPFYKN